MSAPTQRRGLHTPQSLAVLASATMSGEALRLFAVAAASMARGDRDAAAIAVEALFAETGREAPADVLEAIRPGWAAVERV